MFGKITLSVSRLKAPSSNVRYDYLVRFSVEGSHSCVEVRDFFPMPLTSPEILTERLQIHPALTNISHQV